MGEKITVLECRMRTSEAFRKDRATEGVRARGRAVQGMRFGKVKSKSQPSDGTGNAQREDKTIERKRRTTRDQGSVGKKNKQSENMIAKLPGNKVMAGSAVQQVPVKHTLKKTQKDRLLVGRLDGVNRRNNRARGARFWKRRRL